MRKFLTALVAAPLLLLAGLTVPAAQAISAPPETATHVASRTVPSRAMSPESAQWSTTTWKLGGRPATATLCVANGIASDYPYASLIEAINNPNFQPSITVLNRCDGYSITNRMTIESYVQTGTTVCAKYTNTHQAWDAVQGKYIWDENIVLWYNNSTYCIGDGTGPVRSHRVGMYMEYILGLQYDTTVVNAVICSASSCYYDVPYVTYEDQRRLGYVYGQKA